MFNVLSHRQARLSMAALAVVAVTLATNVPAHGAPLTLTPAGIADGFTLTTFASGGPNGTYPFLAAAPLSSGTLAVVDNQVGLKTYNDVDGQTPVSFLNSRSLPGVINIANAGGNTYAAVQNGGLNQVSPSLGLTPVATPGFTFTLGLAGNPVTGHLLAAGNGSGGSGIYDVNPLTGTSTLISNGGFDGVSVSPDGKIVYGEIGGNSILGFNIATHAQVFTHNSTHSPDGTGVISGGPFDGFIISNNNDGTVGLIDPTGLTETIIASGGLRGDFTSPDTNNGSLLLSEYGSMFRLTAQGGTFGGPGATVPEPTSIAIFGLMAVGGAVYGWRRRKPAVAA